MPDTEVCLMLTVFKVLLPKEPLWHNHGPLDSAQDFKIAHTLTPPQKKTHEHRDKQLQQRGHHFI